MRVVMDPSERKSAALSRLRTNLRKKKEALADQFEFKMYIIFHFNEVTKKPCAVFEVSEVVPLMTNNYEDSILQGVKEQAYSLQSSKELLEKDVVQLHAARWHSRRKDVIGCSGEIDFFLWPRTDIHMIECLLFSRWKHEKDADFKPIQAEFKIFNEEYENQLMRLLIKKERSGLIVNNKSQSMFVFVDRNQLKSSTNKAIVFKLTSVCLYLPQDHLLHWGPGSHTDIMQQYLPT